MDYLPPSLKSCVLDNVVLGAVEVGRGAHGRVLAATWEGAPVAVKEIHSLFNEVASDYEYQTLRDKFLEECVRSSQMRHPNIVRFLGILVPSPQHIPQLVMERLVTNLDQLLMKNPVIPDEIKYSILHGVSLGIRFLHTRKPSPIIHRDLSSKNVLVSASMEGKIADLGTARFVDEKRRSKMTRAPGTADFMPPEVLDESPKYTVAVDVFSFGCVMLHTLAHEWPTPTYATLKDQKTRALKALTELERRDAHMRKLIKRPSGIPDRVKTIISQCLSNEADERPKIQAVSNDLAKMHRPYESMTALEAQVLLQKTRDNFKELKDNMMTIHSFLFPEASTPDKSNQPFSPQVSVGSDGGFPHILGKLPSVSEEVSHTSPSPAVPSQHSPVAITTTPSVLASLPATFTAARTGSDEMPQSLNVGLLSKEPFVDQRSQPVLDDVSLARKKPAVNEAPNDTAIVTSHVPPLVAKETTTTEMVTTPPSKQVKLDERSDRVTVQTHATETAPVVPPPEVTSDVVMKVESAAVDQAAPKLQPLPSKSKAPIASTADTGRTPQRLPTAKPTTKVFSPAGSSQQQVSSTTKKSTQKIIPLLEAKYSSLLDNLPENFESSIASLQHNLTDDQICDILCAGNARASNQKILDCLIEKVYCEEDVLDLCTNLGKIMGPPALVNTIEDLRRDTVESLQATSSTGNQRFASSGSSPQLKPSEGDHMGYSQMASACLAAPRHISSHPHAITKQFKGFWKDYSMKWEQVDDLIEKCMSTSVVEMDGNVYAVLENTAARFLNVRMYSSEANAWTSLPPLQYGGSSLAVIPEKKQLLAIGGIYHPDSNCSDISKKAYMWDNKYETWLAVYPDMSTARCYCCSIGYKSMVIVAGGTERYEGHRNSNSVEILIAHDTNPKESHWCVVRSLPSLHYQYMVPVLVNNTLYIATGFRKGMSTGTFSIISACIPTLLASTNRDFHPVWNRLPELHYASFSISHFDGHLVAFGGEQLDVTGQLRLDGLRRLSPMSSIHVYKPASREWEEVGQIPRVYSMGCAVHLQENKIMFVGGFADPSCMTDNHFMTTCSVLTISK